LQTGYVQLRRGILEHLLDGRITADEYTVYSLIILLANHKTGIWLGCAIGITRHTKWSERQSQVLLKSLREKGYIQGEPSIGRGAYPIKVVKYFSRKAHPHAPSGLEGAPPCALPHQKAHPHAPYQEVKQEVNHKNKAAQPRRGPAHRTEFEQRRIVQAQANRLDQQAEVYRETHIGAGPVAFGHIRPEVLERIRAREQARAR